MSSVILLLTILTLGFFSLKSLKNPGYALGILWAMFSVEQYLGGACFIWLPITAKMAAKRSSIMALGFGFCIVLVGIYILAETGVRRWESQFVEQASNGRFV